jgi:hypothetical protein
MRPIYVTNEERVARVDDVLVKGALIVATAIALAVALVAIHETVVWTALACAALAACAVWSLRANEVRRDFGVPLDAVWDVAVESLGENGFLFGETTWDGATEGAVHADDATILAERHPGDFTRVRVRVGTFRTPDNVRRAGLILESISRHLTDRACAKQ